jgi:hypothetical protein
MADQEQAAEARAALRGGEDPDDDGGPADAGYEPVDEAMQARADELVAAVMVG